MEHLTHGRDAGGVEAQRLVERLRSLPRIERGPYDGGKEKIEEFKQEAKLTSELKQLEKYMEERKKKRDQRDDDDDGGGRPPARGGVLLAHTRHTQNISFCSARCLLIGTAEGSSYIHIH